ncbi:MAG: tRNA dihydrouridine synthase DusB [archaeon]
MAEFPKLKNKAILSPMAGVTDVAFRALARKYGAGLTYTEFVSSAAIVRGNKTSLRMLDTDPSEKPVAVQLFGSNVTEVVEAAKLLEKRFDVIDINCGCPAWKVIKTGAGSEMLKEPKGVAKLVSKLTSVVSKPITIKIRIGIDEKNINAVEVAKAAEKAGAAAIAVHGRTQVQGYSAEADWKIIKQVKKAVSIPVIGNGDVDSPEVFKKRLEESGVDYIMIARAAMTNPYIFKQINDFVKIGKYNKKSKEEQFLEYLEFAEKYKIPYPAVRHHAIKFSRGIVGGAKQRQEMLKCKTTVDLKSTFQKL